MLLSSVICRNSDHIEQSPVYLMKRTDSRTNPETDCKQLDTFDFEPFREDAEQPQRNRAAKIATDRMKVLVFEPKATGTTTEHAVGAEVQDEEEGERQAASTTTVATTTDATTTTTTTTTTTMKEAAGA